MHGVSSHKQDITYYLLYYTMYGELAGTDPCGIQARENYEGVCGGGGVRVCVCVCVCGRGSPDRS